MFEGDAKWKAIQIPQSQTYAWDEQLTYIRHPPPFFAEIDQPVRPIQQIKQARILAVLGDSVTTDHFPLQAISKKIVLPDDICSNRGVMQKTLTLMDPAVATMR